MPVPTLILSHRHTEDSQRLWRAAGEIGWRVERTGMRVPDDLKCCNEPVLYVEALLAPTMGEAFGLTLSEPPNDWLPNLPPEYRRRTVRLSVAEDARWAPGRWFAKPPNDKSWPARVYDSLKDLPELEAKEPVLLSEVVEFEIEYRCFVLDRQVKTFSVYLRDGQLQKDTGYASSEQDDREMLEFAAEVLADERVRLPRAVVMDVGRLKRDRMWAAVELNAAWGSGLYGCDAQAALEVIRHAMGR